MKNKDNTPDKKIMNKKIKLPLGKALKQLPRDVNVSNQKTIDKIISIFKGKSCKYAKSMLFEAMSELSSRATIS